MASYIGSSEFLDTNEFTDICKLEHPAIVVAALDFGTTFSGYAFSFVARPNDVNMNKSWAQNFGFQSYKTPTSVLVGPDGKFKAFGYEAEEIYSGVIEEDNTRGHEMYRHFKMMLHKEGVSRSSKIKSVSGKAHPAMDIFAMSLTYLKNHMLTALSGHTDVVLEDDMVKWVITVPAIWNDEAKQFMREAACKAGLIDSISSQKLTIALEPEAASIYCKNLDINHFAEGSTVKTVKFEPGTRYMVIDAGGGTIDITAYEVLNSGQLKELLAANGGPWGGIKVDENFTNLMKEVLGERFVEIYQTKYPTQWFQFMVAFERCKKGVKCGEQAKIAIQLSWAFGRAYMEIMDGRDFEKSISEASESGVTFKNGSLVLDQKAVERLFEPVVSEIVEHVNSIINASEMIDYLLLVGGFGECEYLQNGIVRNFPNIKVIVPTEAQMSVIKGAVMHGHDPSHIESRIARKTYGKNSIQTFDPDVHDTKYKIIVEGRVKCDKLFTVFVQQGEQVPIGKVVTSTSKPLKKNQDGMSIKLFTLDRKSSTSMPEYVDTPGFCQVGKLQVDMPDLTGGRKRKVDIKISFGGTEIHAFARDRTSGCTANTTIDFLAD